MIGIGMPISQARAPFMVVSCGCLPCQRECGAPVPFVVSTRGQVFDRWVFKGLDVSIKDLARIAPARSLGCMGLRLT